VQRCGSQDFGPQLVWCQRTTAKVIGLALITSIYDFLLNYILILAIYNKTWP
jgi:hypothetical protein